MKRYELSENLNNYLQANWTQTDIAWEGLSYNVSGNTPYIKPYLLMGNSVQAEIGGGNTSALDTENGVYHIRIFSPISQGIMKAQIIGEMLRTLFRRQSPINGVTVGNTSLRDNGIDADDERFYMSVLTVDIHNFICE